MKRLIGCLCFFLSVLTGCGGGSDTAGTPERLNSPPSTANIVFNGDGEISLPANSNTFSGNLLLRIMANDPIGLAQVALRFSEGGPSQILCDSAQACGSNYVETVSGINPGAFGAQPGVVTVELVLTDTQGQTATVSRLPLNWQPPTIDNVVVTRSANDAEISIAWQANSQLLRYNLYLASQTGVNKDNYLQWPNGQALLAVSQGPQTFTNLNPGLDYFVLIAGIDGSGESTNMSEIAVPSGGFVPNSSPVANDDVATVDEDDVLQIDVLLNDTDADGDTLNLTNTSATVGTADVANNLIVYTPPADFNGDVTIDYTVSDGNGGEDNATVAITVTPVNDDPDAVDDFASTQQDTQVNIDVLANDGDIDGDALSIIDAVFNAGSGVIESDNSITYDPQPGFSGTDTFDYTVSDGNGGQAMATVEVDVGLNSRPPIANNDNYVAFANETLTIDISQGLLVNDADPDGDPISVIIPTTDPSSGTLTLAADGSFTYTPAAAFTGTDTFAYEIEADNGQTQTAMVNIEVRTIPADLSGESDSITGEFLYIGQGEFQPPSGRGSGLYRIGDCLQDTNTRCHMQGIYQEDPTSGGSPGQTGRYAFIQSYSGNGNSPVLSVSETAGSNILRFSDIGDVRFDLYLFPDDGGLIRALYPESPFSDSLNFGAFIAAGSTCTGLPSNTTCSIGEVGLVAGAQLSAPLDRLTFSQPGAKAASDSNLSPQAQDDNYTTSQNTQLTVNAPGVLTNDSDPDTPTIGTTLEIVSQFSPAIGALAAIGFDEFSQQVYTSANLGATIQINNRLGALIKSIPIQGEQTQNVDIEIASEALQLAGSLVPQGSLLLINGQTGPAEIYAFDPVNEVAIAQLNTNFGNGDVIGGAYNPVTGTIFLLQGTNGGATTPTIAEVNPTTGTVINSFDAIFTALDFEVGLGDLDINNQTGSLYVISSLEINIMELTRSGGIVRFLNFPNAITQASGLALSEDGERIWVSSQNGNAFELGFANGGVAPQLQAGMVVTTENGTLISGSDGSFIYTPDAGFVGEDIFTYEIQDGKGKNSLANVRITVTN